ncbi:MAG: pyridoxal phosphate-dependent decarboxylase family protein [Anaerolineae bacterium]
MVQLPSKGMSREEVLAALRAAREHDTRWHEGRAWCLVYHAGDDILDLLKEAYTLFFSENALNPMAFPSLRKFEAEVVAMTASLLGGDEETAGTMTSGGTESILMAVKTARDWARAHRPEVDTPEMVLPTTAHPAFHKAAHYFGVRPVVVPVDRAFRADVEAARRAITPRTVLLVGSAPTYPHGVVDPIADLAALAQEHGCLFHVDACVGGFMLPFVRKLGYPVPDFDFRVPGVTSISVDLHKYAYAAKGASVVLYRTRALRRHQFSVYTDWPGGVYASPAMAGTRPGGSIAAAWAVLHYLGEEGYLALADTVMRATTRLREGIAAIPGLHILGEPAMSILAIGSDRVDVYEVADELHLRGWHLDRGQFPPSLHLTVTPAHAPVVDAFLADLAQAVAAARRLTWHRVWNAIQVRAAQVLTRALPERMVSALMARASALAGGAVGGGGGRSAAVYGMLATLPNRGDLENLVLDLLDSLTEV